MQAPDVRATQNVPDVNPGSDEARVLDRYVQLVSGQDSVQKVLVEPTAEGLCVWTVIDAEPLAFDPRKPVYNAELQASHVAQDAQVCFHLVNRRESS